MWFNGPVTEAVSLVNTKNCVFIVYIFDESENSQKLDATLDSETVVQKITKDAVALKMHKDSDNAKLFQQLYPMPHVPILYFISQGTIKEFGTQDTTEEEMIAKIDKTATSQQPTSSSPAPSHTTNHSPVSSTPPPSATSSSTHQSSSPDALAKKEKLRKQMEEARKKREEKEKQDAREREMKRREDGKTMQQTKQQMEDQRNKQHFAKLKKEKKEEEAHRRKIKEQIARDRAEQIAARQAAKKHQSENLSSSSSSLPQQRKSPRGQDHDSSHISIRQLDGSSIRNKFQAMDTLSTVKDWIDQNRTDGDQPYKLLSQFPTRQFSMGDEQRTLKELELCPSATIIMKGIKNVSHAYNNNNNGSYMDYVYSAGGMLYNAASTVGSTMSGVVYSLFPAEPAVASGHAGQNVVGEYPGNHQQREPPSSSSFGGQRLGGEPPTGPRTSSSNVNTLRTSEFDDDEDGRTYNGNSLNQE